MRVLHIIGLPVYAAANEELKDAELHYKDSTGAC